MKMYCLFCTDRQKYFRLVFDGRDFFTVKPSVLTTDRKSLEDQIKRYRVQSNWERYGHTDKAPKFVIKTFEASEVNDADSKVSPNRRSGDRQVH